MLKKINLFITIIAITSLITTTTYSTEVIKAEDEALLEDIFNTNEDTQKIISQNTTSNKTPSPIVSIEEEQANITNKTTPEISPQKNDITEDMSETNDDTTSSITPPTPNAFADQDELPPLRSILYPTKEERAKNRQEEKEWFKPHAKGPIIPNAMSTIDNLDPYLEEIKSSIHSCLSENEEQLEIEKSLLKKGNLYDNSAYISQTFENINNCYETIALDIISIYYNNSPITLNNFKEKSKSFFVTGSGLTFDVSHCDNNCSMEAIVESQIVKFKDYRTYLSELLANRPTLKGKNNVK